jgi:UDP-N-acetylmuramate--alanine ligase
VIDILAGFEGIGRRFADVGRFATSAGEVMLIEDYGHHPSELTATITAARSGWPDKRIVVVFQPHRYSRTHALFDEFSQALADADAVVLTDIYPAGEAAIDGVDSGALCQSIRARGRVNPVLISDVFDLPRDLPAMLEDGDLVLLLGAGNIGQVAQEIREKGFCGEAAA